MQANYSNKSLHRICTSRNFAWTKSTII